MDTLDVVSDDVPDMLAVSSWGRRSDNFKRLRLYDDGRPIVAMELDLKLAPELAESWERIIELWLGLPRHPNVLDALHRDGNVLLLRYAAIDWVRTFPCAMAAEVFARWGAQLSHAFGVLQNEVPERELGFLLRPFAKIDVAGDARLGFLPLAPTHHATTQLLPPEAVRTWPRCDERSRVVVVARLMSELCRPERDAKKPMSVLLEDATQGRIETLAGLRNRFILIKESARAAVRQGPGLSAWELAEEAAGHLALDRLEWARDIAERALDEELGTKLVCEVRYAALRRMNKAVAPFRPRIPGRRMTGVGVAAGVIGPRSEKARAVLREWSHVADQGVALERERAFAKALALYQNVDAETAPRAVLFDAMARCHLALGDAGHAVDFARRALAIEPARVTAHAILIRGLLAIKSTEQALSAADALFAVAPYDGGTHYLQGRCLLVASRLVEARESFDQAIRLAPKLIEAMMLRREVDRAIGDLQRTTGVALPLSIELPEHLAELRPLLTTGTYEPVIERLRRPEHADDAIAQLILASCLEWDQRYDEAIDTYDRVTAEPHRPAALVGKASVLLVRGRPEDALTEIDAALALEPEHADAIECRSRILEQLGRREEAQQELRRFVAIATARSDLRVRAARLRLAPK